MISFLKKTLFLLVIALSFFPISFDISIDSEVDVYNLTSLIEITPQINKAYAINLQCDTFAGYSTDLSCSVSEGILSVWEVIWFYTSQIALVLVGIILDVFVFLSINSQFYKGGMIEAGWEILRDFTNVIFIFSLLVIAFKIVLDTDSGNAKKTLVRTLLIATTVNFSLFISFAVIDASNLLAHTFYNKIDAKGGYNTQSIDPNDENATSLSKFITQFVDEDTQSISLAIAGNVNPQLIITGNSSQGFLENFIIITAAGLVNVMLIFIYVKMIAVFLGRTLGLLFSSMLSAAAFASLTIPGLENQPYIGFSNWLKELISTAFMAPVFLFFIYLTVVFLKDEGFLASMAGSPSDAALSRILTVFIPFLVIGGILMLAKKISTDMVGELGKMATKGVGMLAGGIIAAPVAVAGGAAVIGGAAAAGGGGIMTRIGASMVKNGASGVGKTLIKGGKASSRVGRKMMSFKADPTKIPGFKQLAGKDLAKSIGKVTGKSAMGHIRDYQKNTKPIFSNEDGKLTSDKENKELKDANDKANSARRKEEMKYEADLYQKRMEAEIARKKRDDKKDGFTDRKGKQGGYKEAKKQSNEEKLTLEKLNSNLEKIKNNGIDANYTGSDIDKNKAAQEKKKEMASIEANINISHNNMQTSDSYIESISTELKKKNDAVDTKRTEQKAAGEHAENKSRIESASKVSTAAVAEKIIKKKKAKGKAYTKEDMDKFFEEKEKPEKKSKDE
mgnify:FL=1